MNVLHVFSNKSIRIPKAVNSSSNDKNSNGTSLTADFWLTPKTKKETYALFRADRIIKCSLKSCWYKFNSLDTMRAHRACHNEADVSTNEPLKSNQKTSSNTFSCLVCNKAIDNWPSCSLHLWNEHQVEIDLFTCPICSKLKTYGTSNMMQHLARHWQNLGENNVECSGEKMETGNDWYSKLKCKLCEKSFADCKSLKKHVQGVHKKIKPFICNVCGHSVTRKHTMQLHMRQHTGEKPFACGHCVYRTGDHNTLRKHMMKHTGVRPYKCQHCPYACIQNISLKQHIKSAHPDNNVDVVKKRLRKSMKSCA